MANVTNLCTGVIIKNNDKKKTYLLNNQSDYTIIIINYY